MPQHLKCLATVIYDLPLITIQYTCLKLPLFWHYYFTR